MPLKKIDLWELPQPRLTNTITADVERNFYSRCPSNKRPAFIHLLSSDVPLSDSELGKTESISEGKGDKPGDVEPSKTEETTKKYDESLFKALHHTFFKRIWVSGFLLVISGKRKKKLYFGMYWFFVTFAYTTDTLRTTTPLLNQVILTWLADSYVYFRLSDTERTAIPKPRGIGYGIGLAFALFAMQG